MKDELNEQDARKRREELTSKQRTLTIFVILKIITLLFLMFYKEGLYFDKVASSAEEFLQPILNPELLATPLPEEEHMYTFHTDGDSRTKLFGTNIITRRLDSDETDQTINPYNNIVEIDSAHIHKVNNASSNFGQQQGDVLIMADSHQTVFFSADVATHMTVEEYSVIQSPGSTPALPIVSLNLTRLWSPVRRSGYANVQGVGEHSLTMINGAPHFDYLSDFSTVIDLVPDRLYHITFDTPNATKISLISDVLPNVKTHLVVDDGHFGKVIPSVLNFHDNSDDWTEVLKKTIYSTGYRIFSITGPTDEFSSSITTTGLVEPPVVRSTMVMETAILGNVYPTN